MKKVLITGANSYIGLNLEKWLGKWDQQYKVETVDMINSDWKERDFSGFDAIFHVAAVVHKKEKPEMEGLYFKVNKDLPIEVAKKAKKAGVKQFIFMSTMAVYGEEGKLGEELVIGKDTKPNPKTYYGKSKFEAELELNKLNGEKFKVVILRPPMIYGPNCPGNYASLERIALKIPVFPNIENKRSMLDIDKLCEYIKSYIDDEVEGVFLPQDDEYINTSLLVKGIAKKNGKRTYLSKFMGWIIILVGKRSCIVNKVFGNLTYEK